MYYLELYLIFCHLCYYSLLAYLIYLTILLKDCFDFSEDSKYVGETRSAGGSTVLQCLKLVIEWTIHQQEHVKTGWYMVFQAFTPLISNEMLFLTKIYKADNSDTLQA